MDDVARAIDTQAGNADPAAYHDPKPFTLEARGLKLAFYPAGDDRFRALLKLIDGATQTLRLCFYIFSEDRSGVTVRGALIEAVRRGVDVQIIVDGFAAEADDAFFADFCAAGGDYCRFSAKAGRRYLIRNHQKMVIADRQRAMIGGFNIEDDYFAAPSDNGWHDLGVVLTGPAVADLGQWFDELQDWASRPEAQLRAIRRKVAAWEPGDGPVRLTIGGPSRKLSGWARQVAQDFEHARRLDMIMAYFSPSKRLLKSIGRIARTGDARLIMAGKSDNGATLGATRSFYSYLLDQGTEIHEFMPCKLHMKLIVVDDITYLGSANFDARSLYINLEMMLRIEDAGLADRMREFIAGHRSASREITPALHRRHATLWNRIRWNLSWFLVSVVDYTVSRKLNLGL